jgi:hypothetical protein
MNLESLKRDLSLLKFGGSKGRAKKSKIISTKLKLIYYLLKNTPYNIEFLFIYDYLLSIDIGILINEYYGIDIKHRRLIYDIMKNEYIKFFDDSKSCIINLKNNENFAVNINIYYDNLESKPIFLKTEIKPDISILQQGLKICEEKSKYKSDNIISNLYIHSYYQNQKADVGHSNTLIFNKSKREIYRIEPDYATQEEIDNMNQDEKITYDYFSNIFIAPINNALSEYFKDKLEYTYKGDYPFNNRTYPTHGGFCNFLSILTFYTNVKLTRELVKENLLNFVKWEYRKFSGQRLNERFTFTDYKKSLNYLIDSIQGEYAGKVIKSVVIDNEPLNIIEDEIVSLNELKKFNKITIKTFSLLNKFTLNFNYQFKS